MSWTTRRLAARPFCMITAARTFKVVCLVDVEMASRRSSHGISALERAVRKAEIPETILPPDLHSHVYALVPTAI